MYGIGTIGESLKNHWGKSHSKSVPKKSSHTDGIGAWNRLEHGTKMAIVWEPGVPGRKNSSHTKSCWTAYGAQLAPWIPGNLMGFTFPDLELRPMPQNPFDEDFRHLGVTVKMFP